MAIQRAASNDLDKRPNNTMKTIDKALFLLGFFSLDTPEYRLSDLARAANVDKATAMRILGSLSIGGLIEQHPETKKYRLGTAVLHLARLREASFPVVSVIQPILDALTLEVGESTHACLFAGSAMTTIAIAEPQRPTRVYINPAEALPLHATASGLAYLAHVPEAMQKNLIKRIDFKTHAKGTVRNKAELMDKLEETRLNGLAVSWRSFEDEVTGIAAPIFDWHGKVQATLSATCISNRLTDKALLGTKVAVLKASQKATQAMGGASPVQTHVATREQR
ncbi:MAG: IclR family transcriptional regulator [Alphaproteobacteria bacterium]|nr:IclR family transcriptional regulator [Alphaproteobacteria bacterium]